MKGMPICAPTRIAADGAVSAIPGRIWAVELAAGSDASSVQFTNDANGAGTNVLVINTAANQGVYRSYVDLGGVNFDTKCYCDITGTGAVAFVWYA
jgi:hypothetical protein